MGKIEDSIKQDIYKTVVMDTIKMYEFINTRFDLSEEQKDAVVMKLNNLTKDLTAILDGARLS